MTIFGAALHLIQIPMARLFELEAGFRPVWWLDCPACGHPSLSLAADVAWLGGVSVPTLIATVAAICLVTTWRMDGNAVKALGWVLGIAGLVHLVSSWVVRYPASLPVLLVAVLPAMIATVLAISALVVWRPGVPPRIRPGSVLAALAYISGAGAMLALGGFATPILALAVQGWAWPRTSPWQRRWVVAGAVLAVTAVVGRSILATRYRLYFWWL